MNTGGNGTDQFRTPPPSPAPGMAGGIQTAQTPSMTPMAGGISLTPQLAAMSNPEDRVRFLTEQLHKSEEMLNTMKLKTKEYVGKLKGEHITEKNQLTTEYEEKIKKLIAKVKEEHQRNATLQEQLTAANNAASATSGRGSPSVPASSSSSNDEVNGLQVSLFLSYSSKLTLSHMS